MAEEITENWTHILINGKSKKLEVKDAEFDKGKLVNISEIKNYPKLDGDNKEIKHTAELANNEKRKVYKEFFQKPFKNLIILTGAGSSMDVGGKSMYQLWDIAESIFHFEEDNNKNIKSDFKALCLALNFDYGSKNLESLLSHIEGVIKFSGDSKIKLKDGEQNLSEIKKVIFATIKEECTIPSPQNGTFPHKVLLEKVLQRKQTSPRVKVFTLNYDTLFEAAATAVNAIVIDGFSYTFPRKFSGRYFDYDIVQREGSKLKEEDNFIQRVFHLHKLHGSINWFRNKEVGTVEIKENQKELEEPLMVYPREAKYEDSYEQPFFEMMARFQRNLRLNDDTLLVCLGYSFNDKHINAAIEEAFNQNPGFRLAVIDPFFDNPNSSKLLQELKNKALETERIIMISETFTDFASYFPEIQTYNDVKQVTLNIKND